MRKILNILVIGLLLTSCNKDIRTNYVINGTAKDFENGIKVYLSNVDLKGQQIVKDSATVMNEKFTMKGSVAEPSVHFLSVNGVLGNAIFMLENSEIDIELNKKYLMESKVTGSRSNELCWAYQQGIKAISEEGSKIMIAYRESLTSNDSIKSDSLENILEKQRLKLKEYPLSFIKENDSSYFTLNLIGLETNKSQIDISGFKEAFDNFPSNLKTTAKGLEIEQKINKLYDDYKKIAHLDIGKVAPNFEAPTPNGDIISLDAIKGKVTVIDFWAGWSDACRRLNLKNVEIYNKYHSQGLEIISISLDGEKRQKDPKKAWLDAIERDNLTWYQVSNLKYYNDPVAKLYNIKAIPATYILDAEGKIAAKNLRGEALEKKIVELLKKS
jgi:peroxiredoxin